jgi:glycosyltransferase involved in cell wall biosynthesis
VKLALVDPGGLDYTPATPLDRPLGGMQSGLCYLSTALARRGHEVTLINNTRAPGAYLGVRVLRAADALNPAGLADFDAVVSIACDGAALRRAGVRGPLLLWTGHDVDVPEMARLSDRREQAAWDLIVFKSQWQWRRHQRRFGIDPGRVAIIRNAMAPPFEAAPLRTAFFFDERRPPVLAYTSTPFRGLEVLLRAMPRIRAAIPGCRLKVYSSLEVYQLSSEGGIYAELYDRARAMDGVDYVGSLGQRDLARAMAEVDVLAYPSMFRETACIALMEAMACGCLVVANRLGALPETAAGFAELFPWPPLLARRRLSGLCAPAYAAFMVRALRRVQASPDAARDRLAAQMTFARQAYNWTARAADWESLLIAMRERGQGRGANGAEPC